MFERFTQSARQVVAFAQEEARRLKHDYIGTEHLLLGLLRHEEGVAADVLASLGVTLEAARAQVAEIVGSGAEVAAGQIPFTPRAKKVLELALREALSVGHNYIGAEHILLGLARENEGVASRVLRDFDADSEKIHNDVVHALAGRSGIELPPLPAGIAFGERAAVSTAGGRGRRRRTWQAESLLVGWSMFGIASGLGLLVGWLIWG